MVIKYYLVCFSWTEFGIMPFIVKYGFFLDQYFSQEI